MKPPLSLDQSAALLAGLAVIVPLIALALEPAARPPGFHTTQKPASNHHWVHHNTFPRVRLLRPHRPVSLRENVTAPARVRQHQGPRPRQPSSENQRAHQRDEDQYQEVEQYWQEPLVGAEAAGDEVAPSSSTATSLIRLMSEPTAGTSSAPSAVSADGDRGLLCLFRVYMDSFVSMGEVDMNDRLVFLVPLIIIYWHHRHPHHGLPYHEIDGLLRDIGPDGEVHRLVLQKVSKRIGSECAHENGPLASTLSRQHNKQAKALEAMRILREWLDEEERLEEQTARQSGAREIRHWFRDLVGANKRRGSSGIARPSAAAPASPTTAKPVRVPPVATTAAPRDQPAHETTTDFYGLPNFENRTREYQDQLGVTTPSPTGMNMTLLNELNQFHPPKTNSSSSGADSLSSEGEVGRPELQPPTHYGEFFDLVSSIIEEINVLHNSTAAIMATPTTPPTIV